MVVSDGEGSSGRMKASSSGGSVEVGTVVI